MAGFNSYNNPYNYNPSNYNPYIQEFQNMRDSIDRTMQRYQQQQQQNQMMPQQPANVTQNFQIAPIQQQNDLQAKYVNDIDEVKNTFVMREGIFINKDMTTLWVKNVSGDIKSYSLQEIIEIDPKDLEITNLKNELASMRAMLQQQIAKSTETNESEIAPAKTEKKSSK